MPQDRIQRIETDSNSLFPMLASILTFQLVTRRPLSWLLLAFMGVGATFRYKHDSRPMTKLLITTTISALVLGAVGWYFINLLGDVPIREIGFIVNVASSQIRWIHP